jgi:hypothetical protein
MEPVPPVQPLRKKKDTTKPPYNGLFWCAARQKYVRWDKLMQVMEPEDENK